MNKKTCLSVLLALSVAGVVFAQSGTTPTTGSLSFSAGASQSGATTATQALLDPKELKKLLEDTLSDCVP